MTGLVLHNFFRSSTSVRLRAALNLKGLKYEYVAYHLRKGEQRDPSYLAINPQGLVPSLELEDGTYLTQSLAIIEYLDEVYSTPRLLPSSALERARVRALAYAVACDIHPINNLRVLAYIKGQYGLDEGAVNEWAKHWVIQTFTPLEQMLSSDARTGDFCHGNSAGLADVCLFAQVLSNRRFGIDLAAYPTIGRIFDACMKMPEFIAALPDKQPDAE